MDMEHLRYRLLNEWDKAMMRLDDCFAFLSNPHQMGESWCSSATVLEDLPR